MLATFCLISELTVVNMDKRKHIAIKAINKTLPCFSIQAKNDTSGAKLQIGGMYAMSLDFIRFGIVIICLRINVILKDGK